MCGIAYDRFGDESVLQLRDDLPDPPVGPDVVLVRVHAAGVNPVALGAHVIGTAGPKNHGFLTDAGVAEVLDYSAGPISAQLSEPVDAVLDLVGGDTLADAPKQVRDPARIASVVDPGVRDLGGRY